MSSECIFCKIVEGEMPCYKIYETEKAIAFLDINPVAKAHTLVIPKEHIERIELCDDETLKELMMVVKKVGTVIAKTYHSDFNLVLNNGESAGQLIKHLHFHIIPRVKGDEITIDKQRTLEIDKKELEKIAKEMAEQIRRIFKE